MGVSGYKPLSGPYTIRPEQNGRRFTDDFLDAFSWWYFDSIECHLSLLIFVIGNIPFVDLSNKILGLLIDQ